MDFCDRYRYDHAPVEFQLKNPVSMSPMIDDKKKPVMVVLHGPESDQGIEAKRQFTDAMVLRQQETGGSQIDSKTYQAEEKRIIANCVVNIKNWPAKHPETKKKLDYKSPDDLLVLFHHWPWIYEQILVFYEVNRNFLLGFQEKPSNTVENSSDSPSQKSETTA